MPIDEQFLNSLEMGTLDAVTHGAKSVLVWGFTPECVRLVTFMKVQGLDSLITGIVDHRTDVHGTCVESVQVCSPELIPSLKVDVLVIAVNENKGRSPQRILSHR